MKILHEAEYICECDFWNDEPKFCPTQELIRCKDCKHWGEDGYHNGCRYANCIMEENDYCSMAERKEE